MNSKINQTLELFHPEIVIGLIGGIGTDFDSVIKLLENEFSECGYRIEKIKISELFNNLKINTQGHNKKTHFKSKESRLYIKLPLNNDLDNAFIKTYKEMQAGSYLRRYNRDILARLTVARINELRGKSNTLGKVVYILKSLKRKEEFDFLNKNLKKQLVKKILFHSKQIKKWSLSAWPNKKDLDGFLS